MKKSLTFIFRDPKKGGYSIEEIFKGLLIHLEEEFNINVFHYNQQESLLRNIYRLHSFKTDIYHITGDVNFLALFLLNKKIVLTVHDIGHFKNLNGWRKVIYGLVWMQWPISLSKVVTCVSEYTRNDIRYFFPRIHKGIHLVPNPVPAHFEYQPVIHFNENKPRILVIGTGPHKNLPTLFAAVKDIACTVVIIGHINQYLSGLLDDNKIDYENYTNLTQQEVYEQYAKCDLVSFVTIHEGFGMPVLEAQSVGRPVITSKICSLPEVTNGSAAMIENPMDTVALRSLILRIIHEPQYRMQLIEAGLRNIQRFEMQSIVRQYSSLYHHITP